MNISKILKRVAVTLLVAVALLLCVKVIRRTFFPGISLTGEHHHARIGSRLKVEGVDWSQSEQTYVLALNKDCVFCKVSAPLYRRLVEESARREGVRVIALLPHSVGENEKYLDGLGVKPSEVRGVRFESLGIMNTPTIMLVNRAGVVTNMWVGRIPKNSEETVFKRMPEVAQKSEGPRP